jgi:hypothetical protein
MSQSTGAESQAGEGGDEVRATSQEHCECGAGNRKPEHFHRLLSFVVWDRNAKSIRLRSGAKTSSHKEE